MIYRRVLAGTDGSATAQIAERRALQIAQADRCGLILVSAYREDAALAESILASAAARCSGYERVERIASKGDPAEVLLDQAGDEGLDLLVIGNKGMTGSARFLMGSVPNKVSHQVQSDLMIVRTTDRQVSAVSNMLLATDGSETSFDAVEKGLALAERLGAKPHVLYVGHPRTADIVFSEMEAYLQRSVGGTTSVQGDPADSIVGYASDSEIDLIVVGNRGMTQGRFHLASVPNKISHHAFCDVLIVKTVSASLKDLSPGEGAIIGVGGDKVAAYRDKDGEVTMLSPRCQHMGCIVEWNGQDSTWDCPCHGSRYAADGTVLRGPTTKPLPPVG